MLAPKNKVVQKPSLANQSAENVIQDAKNVLALVSTKTFAQSAQDTKEANSVKMNAQMITMQNKKLEFAINVTRNVKDVVDQEHTTAKPGGRHLSGIRIPAVPFLVDFDCPN